MANSLNEWYFLKGFIYMSLLLIAGAYINQYNLAAGQFFVFLSGCYFLIVIDYEIQEARSRGRLS